MVKVSITSSGQVVFAGLEMLPEPKAPKKRRKKSTKRVRALIAG
jgi:hypothetical protein